MVERDEGEVSECGDNQLAAIPSFVEAVQKRSTGIAPNYLRQHRCPLCKLAYYCPDRYSTNSCKPSDFARDHNMIDNDSFTCLPCIDPNIDRSQWYAVHGLADAA